VRRFKVWTQKSDQMTLMQLIKQTFLSIAMACLFGYVCDNTVCGYQADKASTPTLWKLNKTERIAKDRYRRGDHYANRMKTFLEEDITTGGIFFLAIRRQIVSHCTKHSPMVCTAKESIIVALVAIGLKAFWNDWMSVSLHWNLQRFIA